MPTPIPLSPNAITAANAGQVTQAGLWQAYNSNGQLVWAPSGAWLAYSSSPVSIYDVATGQTNSVDSKHAQVLAAGARAAGVAHLRQDDLGGGG